MAVIFAPFLILVLRGIVADSDDTIKASADALGKHGFINYFGLQVLPYPPSLSLLPYFWITFFFPLFQTMIFYDLMHVYFHSLIRSVLRNYSYLFYQKTHVHTFESG